MATCPSPPNISNGFFVIAKGTYVNGDQITYYCRMGYALTGTATRACDGATGSWSGSTPKCTAATTTVSATTTTESTAQVTVVALVLIPVVILCLLAVSLVVLYSIKYLHCQEGCKKQTLWLDGEEYAQYGVWFTCCRNGCVNLCQFILCEKCQKARPSSENHRANVDWKNKNGGTRASRHDSRSSPSQMSSGSVWNTSGDTGSEAQWKPNFRSLSETSGTTITDL